MSKHNAGTQVTLVVVAFLLVAMPARAEWYADARPMMGTEVSVRLWHEDAETGQSLVEAVFAEAHRIDLLM
ncbi:MAG: FAD:protein FMN transferase, partial [Proteobacteria bacterium]|nr:FAD:protein FMN transferase [Pseudomonadota bacterium]